MVGGGVVGGGEDFGGEDFGGGDWECDGAGDVRDGDEAPVWLADGSGSTPSGVGPISGKAGSTRRGSGCGGPGAAGLSSGEIGDGARVGCCSPEASLTGSGRGPVTASSCRKNRTPGTARTASATDDAAIAFGTPRRALTGAGTPVSSASPRPAGTAGPAGSAPRALTGAMTPVSSASPRPAGTAGPAGSAPRALTGAMTPVSSASPRPAGTAGPAARHASPDRRHDARVISLPETSRRRGPSGSAPRALTGAMTPVSSASPRPAGTAGPAARHREP